MKSELKPCPFCGGEAEINRINHISEWMYEARCPECGCGTDLCDEEWRAVEMWNRRAQPANELLTLEELRGMNGEPVWCVDGAGHECWCVVNKENEDCIDNEAGAWIFDFYAMTGDDGLYGLHRQLGWLAYRHKPEVLHEK